MATPKKSQGATSHVDLKAKLTLQSTNVVPMMQKYNIPSVPVNGTNYTPAGYKAEVDSRLKVLTDRDAAKTAYSNAETAEKAAQPATEALLSASEMVFKAGMGKSSPDLPELGINPAKVRVKKVSPVRALKSVAVKQNRTALKAANQSVLKASGNFTYDSTTKTVITPVTGTPAGTVAATSSPPATPAAPASTAPVSEPAAAKTSSGS